MDPPPLDNGSEPTVPSEHGDLLSNLSTMLNISEQNDPGFEDIPNNQRPEDVQGNRENNFQLFSQKVINNRSQSFHQGNSPLPAPQPAPPHLNQARFHEESKENTPIINNASSHKVFQFTTFNEDWERNLKQDEQEREKNYENHVLFNQENEPLLSQRSEMDQHDFFHTDNEPLLSQTIASDHNFSLTHINDPLPSQHSEPVVNEHHLNSIQESKSQSSRSNEVKFHDFDTITEEFQIQHSQTKSQSKLSQVAQDPLFDLGLIDESQSNLLKFGFTVSRNDRKLQISQQSQSNHSNKSNSISINPQNNQREGRSQNQVKSEQQLNLIESEVLGQSQSQLNSRSNHQRINKGGAERIIIQVSDCNSQNINSVAKNNDIYGIIPPESNHISQNAEEEWRDDYPKIEQRQQEEERNQESNQNSGKQQAKLQQYSLKLDNIDNEQKEQPQNSNSVSNPFSDYPQKQQQNGIKNANQPLPQQEPQLETALTFQQIAQQMQNIVQGQGAGVQLTERGVQLLKRHVDFLFIKPLSDIGRQIMSDGKIAVNLIKIILFKESDNQIKEHLRKYLILVFARSVLRNKQALIDFQRQTTSSVHRNHPAPFEKEFNLHPQNQDIGLSAEPVRGVVHVSQSVDQSVQAENGSSTKKHAHEQMDIDDGQRQPVKRTIPTKNLTETRNPSPRSGKVTRRTKYKSKGKGKTTSKKVTVQFQQSSQSQIAVPGTDAPPISRGRKKSQNKQPNPSAMKKESSTKKKDYELLQPHQQNLGSKFTFVFRENTVNHNQQLVQKRVSQRLVSKSSATKIQNYNIDGRSASRRKQQKRVNSGKRYKQEEDIDIDYVKKHFRNISFKSSMMQRDYNALTPEDEEIIELYKSYYEIVDQESRLPQIDNNQSYDPPQNEENTQSIRSQAHSIRQRKEEFKKNISKYKVGEIPIIILRIVDPDINNHGIYALLELAKLSQEVYNARYALTPITNLERASKRLIDLDLAEAKRQVGDEEKDNLVYMKPTGSTLELIKAEKEKKERRV